MEDHHNSGMMKYSYYKYIVVEFDDEGIQIIPRNWLIHNGSATKFPPLTTNNIRYEKFCTKMVEPKDNWNTFNLKRILASCDDFLAAKKKLKKAENQTDLDSTDIDVSKIKRKYTAAKVLESDSDEFCNLQKNVPGFPEGFKQNKTKQILSVPNPPVNDKVSHFGHSLQLPNPPQLYKDIYESHEDKLNSQSSSPDMFNNYDPQFDSLITNDLLANNSKPVEVSIQDHLIPINTSTQQNEKINISENTEVIIISGQNNNNSSTVLSTDEMKSLLININGPLMDVTNQNHLIESVCKMQFKINQMLLVLKNINDNIRELKNTSVNSNKNTDLNMHVYFPIDTEDALLSIEVKLVNDDDFKKQLIYELSKIGGESVKQKTFNALKFLITNKLASCMTYAGIKKNKRGFKTLQLHNIVIDVIRNSSEKATNHKVIKEIHNWIRRASERYRNELTRHNDKDLEVMMTECGPEHGDESCSD
ncbi:uncharacterized protein LOC114129904 isoform X2 [Aphis gossypii]|uniref:uncharacterized protein LOC114129904 isoform X2 n=1 Tax=Aphis gossypii TaxID=80765 RepID=UPI002158C7E2|nr:uncharacterized protein LOC114129904 isoform X2 [Aphis gossypii]